MHLSLLMVRGSHEFLVGLSAFFCILVLSGMIYSARHWRTKRKDHSVEMVWTAVPTFLLLILFAWGYWLHRAVTNVSPNVYALVQTQGTD